MDLDNGTRDKERERVNENETHKCQNKMCSTRFAIKKRKLDDVTCASDTFFVYSVETHVMHLTFTRNTVTRWLYTILHTKENGGRSSAINVVDL